MKDRIKGNAVQRLFEQQVTSILGPVVVEIRRVLKPFVVLHGAQFVRSYLEEQGVFGSTHQAARPVRRQPKPKTRRLVAHSVTKRRTTMAMAKSPMLKLGALQQPVLLIVRKLAGDKKDNKSFTIEDVRKQLDLQGLRYNPMTLSQILTAGFIVGIEQAGKRPGKRGRKVNVYKADGKVISLRRNR